MREGVRELLEGRGRGGGLLHEVGLGYRLEGTLGGSLGTGVYDPNGGYCHGFGVLEGGGNWIEAKGYCE